MLKISEVDQLFKSIFEEAKVLSVESVFETEAEFDKLVISIHEITMDDIGIIHTKFIFMVNKERTELVEDSFIYLFDINCVYHKVSIGDLEELRTKIKDIFESVSFGDDITALSDFLEAPAMFLNYYMMKADVTGYSVFNVKYTPKFKLAPCSETTFDFEISVNNSYNIHLSIKKVSTQDSPSMYKLQFRFLDHSENIELDSLKNIHMKIGSGIAEILDKYL
jgi:hypothetical protein